MIRFLALLIFFTISLDLVGQNETTAAITLKESSSSVKKILKEISRQSKLDFSFNAKKIDVKKEISLAVNALSLEETLELLSQEMGVAYSIVESQIILYLPKNPATDKKQFHTLSGFINDTANGESLIGATVSVLGTARGSITNAFGYYSLQLPPGDHILTYSYIGYEMERVNINLLADIKKDQGLKTSSIELPSVIVATPLRNQLEKRDIDKMVLRPSELENMPEFGGESGLIKGLQALPGIKTHSDGSAFFYTRGGERDQNLIIIDDAPIYSPSHLFGFYSIVIPEFSKSIEIYKNNIPANLGDRISSIINIRTKDGNLNKWEFSGAINPLINRFAIEGPFIKKKGALFFSFRRSNFKWLYQKNSPNAKLGFGDLNFKVNHKFNNKNRLFLTMITSSDQFINNFGNASGIAWGNFATTLRWNHIFGPKLFTNTVLYTGNYLYRLNFSGNSWQSGIGTFSLKTDFTHYINNKLKARFGIEWQNIYFIPGELNTNEAFPIFPEFNRNFSRKTVLNYHLYHDINDRWQVNAGARLISWENMGPNSYFAFDDQFEVSDTINKGIGPYNSFINVDPRFNIKYTIDSTSHFNLSAGSYHQYLQLISNSISPFTSLEVWLPASPNIKPQQSQQLSLSYLKYFAKKRLTFTAATYYKRLTHQIDYIPHANTLLNPLLEGELRFGNTSAYGLELMLKKEFGKLNGWMSYNFSRAIRQTDAINSGDPYPAFQDRPHDFSLMLNYKFSPRVLGSAYWTSFTGSPFSTPTGFYTFNNRTIPIFDEKNNDRLPGYRRLDISCKFILNKKPAAKYQHSLTFSIYNFLAFKNAVAVNFNKIPVAGSRPVIKANVLSEQDLATTQTDLIRFFPSLTYKFKL